jgi:uncharacterized protein (TIGR00661 family)
MKIENFNSPGNKSRVLVAPLDWGLGHATRCIPIINRLLQLDCEVIIAANGPCRFLLEKEFQNLTILDLKGYNIHYSRKKYWMPVKLFLQFPKLFFTVYSEHAWLKKIVKQYSIDAVISDNRLGFYHKNISCVYITHQLKIKTGNWFAEWLAQKIHYRFINKYNECWVPDAAGLINLAGELSHPAILPKVPVKYLGPLSRFEKTPAEIKYDLAIILSGPEPQRTVFEKIVLKDLENHSGRALLIRGLPTDTTLLKTTSSLEIQNHLPAIELNRVIIQSKIIISRSGYTTVMDLIKLQKRAILVPTPGQTEQEHLAGYLLKQGLFLCVEQESFSLSVALNKSEDFSFIKRKFPQTGYEKVIEGFVKNLKPRLDNINNA